MYCELAKLFHKWPHEVAALPFHYYRTIRDYYLKLRAPADDDDDESFDFEEETFTGDPV